MKRLIKKARLPLLSDQYNPFEFDYVNIGIQTILVSDIIGLSEGRVNDYNDDWTPIDKNDSRWKNAYNGYKNNENMPPIPLLKTPDGKYFANGDGNHRISAAKVLGLNQVLAKVLVLVPKDAAIENQWEEYSKNKKEQLNKLYEQYSDMTNDIYKAQDEDKPELERELINKQNQIGQEINSLNVELEKEEKEFKKNLLDNGLVAK